MTPCVRTNAWVYTQWFLVYMCLDCQTYKSDIDRHIDIHGLIQLGETYPLPGSVVAGSPNVGQVMGKAEDNPELDVPRLKKRNGSNLLDIEKNRTILTRDRVGKFAQRGSLFLCWKDEKKSALNNISFFEHPRR